MENNDIRLKVHQPEQYIGQSHSLINKNPQISLISDYHYNGNGLVWLINRDGVCYCLDGSQGRRIQNEPTGLTVHCNHRVASYVQVDMHREMLTIGCFGQDLYNTIKTTPSDHHGRTVFYSSFISDVDLVAKGGSIYIQSLDIVVCTVDPVLHGIRHPFSPANEMSSETISQRNTIGAGVVKIRIIDNDGVTCNKWYRVGDLAIAVSPQQNAELLSGVYFIYKGATEVDEIRKRFSLAELESGKTPIKFFNSKAEALSSDILAAVKLETEQTKLETEQIKARQQLQKPLDEEQTQLRNQLVAAQEQLRKLQQQRQDDDATLVRNIREQHAKELETERKRFAAEAELFKDELDTLRKEREQRVKDRYEDLSYERKNFNEMLKMIPVIVSIVLSVVVLVKAKK